MFSLVTQRCAHTANCNAAPTVHARNLPLVHSEIFITSTIMCIHTAYKILTEKIHQAIPHIPMQTVLRLQKEAPWTDSFHISLSIVLPYIPLQLSSHSVQTNFGSDCPCQQNTRDRDRALTDPEAIGGPLM